MSIVWVLFLLFGTYAFAAKIYQNKMVPEATLKTVFPREIENFEAIDFSSLQKPNYDTRKRSLSHSNFGISAFGENYQMQLSKAEPVLHPNAKIVTRSAGMEEVWDGPLPDCFLTGHVTSHNGTASFSNCDTLEGMVSTRSGELHVRELPKEHNKHLNFSEEDTVLMFGKIKPQNRTDKLMGIPPPLTDKEVLPPSSMKITRRELPSGDAVIELAVYTDSLFTATFPSKDVSKRIELMTLKYNGVQMEFARADRFGRNIKVQIKHMEFWDTNPSFYNTTTKFGKALSTFCAGVRPVSDKYDIQYLHTGSPGDSLGIAYVAATCTDFACAMDGDRSFTGYVALTHEIGHNLGMHHDDYSGCSGDNVGIMGGYAAGWSTCSINSFNEYLESGMGQCLFREEVATELSATMLGQQYSPDDICKKIYGPDFDFREWPKFSECQAYTCVNVTEGTHYGQMISRLWHNIPGSYCGEGKICFKLECTTFEEARQIKTVVRPGGWGNWGKWHPCSRTCGTGVTYRKRLCNNPSPINHPGCEGGSANAYEAKLCNVDPCPSDLLITEELYPNEGQRLAQLRDLRASETCSKMLQNNVLKSSEYTSKGTRYGWDGNEHCEVKCTPVPGFIEPNFPKFGLMPHGTPCELGIPEMDKMERHWPRKKGFSAKCLGGYCRKFGCDNASSGKVLAFDGCGVCGGDGSSCDVVEGTYMDNPGEGERGTIIKMPKGSHHIQILFNYWDMKENYLELYSKDDIPIIVSWNSWIWYTKENPFNYASTYWHFAYSSYLFAEGPISEPVVLKLYQRESYNNTGIHYAFSVPKSVKTCNGVCSNNGVFNHELCSCDCPTGFYGNTCSSRCKKYCFNGATLDESTCQCQCKENQIGPDCKCASGYTGLDCTTKKP